MDCVIQTIPVESAKNRRTAAKDKLVHGAVCRGAGIPTSPSFSHCRQCFSFSLVPFWVHESCSLLKLDVRTIWGSL